MAPESTEAQSPETMVVPETTAAPETPAPETTAVPETTAAPDTTPVVTGKFRQTSYRYLYGVREFYV